jgi:hypothetical protein
MDSSLFLNSILTQNTAGKVTFRLPPPVLGDRSTDIILEGWLIENPSFKLGNNWQSVLPNLEALTKGSQIIDINNFVLSFIQNAQSAWTGIEALTIGLNFYLFSNNKESQIRSKFLDLARLASVETGGTTSFLSYVHGGYKPDAFGDRTGSWINNNIVSSNQTGLITITIGNSFYLQGMLLVDLTQEFSVLEVPDGNPLYIKVSANFKSYRPLEYTELQTIFMRGLN